MNNMNDTLKANLYGQLLNEHRKLHNRITEIKGQNNELSAQDELKIKELERQQVKLMGEINRLLS